MVCVNGDAGGCRLMHSANQASAFLKEGNAGASWENFPTGGVRKPGGHGPHPLAELVWNGRIDPRIFLKSRFTLRATKSSGLFQMR